MGKIGFGSIRSDFGLFGLMKKSSECNPNKNFGSDSDWIFSRINSDSVGIGNIILKSDLDMFEQIRRIWSTCKLQHKFEITQIKEKRSKPANGEKKDTKLKVFSF